MSAHVSAGRLALPDGLVVIFDPGVLGGDRYVEVSEGAPAAGEFPSTAYKPLRQAVYIALSPARPAAATAVASPPVISEIGGATPARKMWLAVMRDGAASGGDADSETVVRLSFPQNAKTASIDDFPLSVGESLVAGFNEAAIRSRSHLCATVWIRRSETSGLGFTFLRRA